MMRPEERYATMNVSKTAIPQTTVVLKLVTPLRQQILAKNYLESQKVSNLRKIGARSAPKKIALFERFAGENGDFCVKKAVKSQQILAKNYLKSQKVSN